MNQTEAKIKRLNEFYLGAREDAEVSFFHQALADEDYLVRAKAFLIAERVEDPALIEVMAKVLSEDEREWQLRAMSVLCHHGTADSLALLRPYLFQRQKPLLIRGAFFSAAEIGGEEAMTLMAEFLASPYRGYLKEEFILSCIRRCAVSMPQGAALWQKLCGDREELKEYASVPTDEEQGNSLLMVYPHPDYLSSLAKEREIDGKVWKQAMYFPRQKKAAEKRNEHRTR